MPELVHAAVVVVLLLNSLRKRRANLNMKENLQINLLLVPRNSSRDSWVLSSLAELGEQSYQLTSAWVLPVWNVVRCIVRCVACYLLPVIAIVLRGVRVTIMDSAFAPPHCLDSAVSTPGLRRQYFPLGE
jgi:hypothetical protein